MNMRSPSTDCFVTVRPFGTICKSLRSNLPALSKHKLVSFLIGSSYAIHTNISLIMSMDTYRMLCISRSFALRRTFLFFIFFQHFRQRGSRRRGQGLHAGRHAPRENGYRGGTGRVSALQISGQINAFSWNIDKQVLDRGMEV